MKKLFVLPALVILTGCDIFTDALVAIDREFSDGYLIARTEIETGEGRAPGSAYHIIRIAENRSGSFARFEGLEIARFLAAQDPDIESVISVSPNGRFVSGHKLANENGVFEFRFGVFDIDPFATRFSRTDDSWPAVMGRDCALNSLFAGQIEAALRSDPLFDPNTPVIGSFGVFDEGNVEWPTATIGWDATNRPVFSVQAEFFWQGSQLDADGLTVDFETFIQTTVFATLSTAEGAGLEIEDCTLTEPQLAPPVATIYETSSGGRRSDPEILIDGASLRLSLQPEQAFKARGGTQQRPVTGVFVSP